VPELNGDGVLYTAKESMNIPDVDPIRTEKIQTVEFGYKGFIGNRTHFTLDYYLSYYEDFFSPPTIITPLVVSRLFDENGNDITDIDNLDLGLSATLLKTKQKNSILNNARTEWVQRNAAGVNTSEGIELSGNWKPADKKISLNFGYTFTDSYDAATCDPDEKAAYADSECRDIGSKVQSAKVRVPRHAIQSKINYNISPNLKSSLKGKYVGETRDFGNANNDYTDVILTNYFVFDLETSYNLLNTYKTFINIGNILDKGYEQAYQYSSMGRTFNFGIRRIY